MKWTMIVGMIALLSTAGAAFGEGPIALKDHELDRITAGTTGPRVGLVNLARHFSIEPLNKGGFSEFEGVITGPTPPTPPTSIEVRIEIQADTPGTQFSLSPSWHFDHWETPN
jgi:hypothetical protein